MTNAKPGFDVDHISHVVEDNKKCNLRVISHAENNRNNKLSKNNTSGVTGVYYEKSIHKWNAAIMIDGKKINLGYYKDIEDAIKVRKEAEEKYFGEFSYDNSMKIAEKNKIQPEDDLKLLDKE